MKTTPNVNWPQNASELERYPEAPSQLESFLGWLSNSKVDENGERCNRPKINAIGDLLLSLITGKRSILQVFLDNYFQTFRLSLTMSTS